MRRRRSVNVRKTTNLRRGVKKPCTVDELVMGGDGWSLALFLTGDLVVDEQNEQAIGSSLSMNRTELAAKERKERTEKAKSLMANHERIGICENECRKFGAGTGNGPFDFFLRFIILLSNNRRSG